MNNINNTVRIKIKAFIADQGASMKEIVELWNQKNPDNPTSLSSFSNKLTRGTIRFDEVIQIADILNCEVEFLPRNGRKIYPSSERDIHQISLMEKSDEGQFEISGTNFGNVTLAGKNAELAGLWLGENLKPNISKSDEILLYLETQKLFDVFVHPLY